MGTGSLPGVKRPGRGVDHPLHLAPRLKKEFSYTSTPPLGFRGLFEGGLYLYRYLHLYNEEVPRLAELRAVYSVGRSTEFCTQFFTRMSLSESFFFLT